MLTFLIYSAFLGTCIVFPFMLMCGYYGEPAGRRTITYLDAAMCLLFCALPIVNVIIAIYVFCTGLGLLGPAMASKNLFSDKGKK